MASISTTSIKKLAIRGAAWTVVAYGTTQLLRFGSNLVLTRLLRPDLFGLMSLVYVFIVGLHLFSDLGINTSVVQNKRGDEPTFLNTAWTMQILRGLLLWFICLIIAVPVSQVYSEPRLAFLLPVVGLSTALSSFSSTAIYTLNRHLSFKQLAIYEITSQFASIAVMLIWASVNRSVWALVAGGFAASITQIIYSHRLNKGEPNRLTWDRSAAAEVFRFGKWIFLSTALTFLANQSDRLILGKLFTLELLGVYGVAFTLADMPRQLVMAVGGKVLFPSYTKMIDLPRSEFREKILRNRRPILLVLAVGLAVFVSFGDLIVNLLYDSRYAAAGWMLPLLALGTWPLMLTQTTDTILLAMGRPQYNAFASFLSFLCYAIGIPLGFTLYGPVGAVLSVAVSNVPSWLVVNYALWRKEVCILQQDLWTTAVFVLTLGAMLGLRYSFGLQNVMDHFVQ